MLCFSFYYWVEHTNTHCSASPGNVLVAYCYVLRHFSSVCKVWKCYWLTVKVPTLSLNHEPLKQYKKTSTKPLELWNSYCFELPCGIVDAAWWLSTCPKSQMSLFNCLATKGNQSKRKTCQLWIYNTYSVSVSFMFCKC